MNTPLRQHRAEGCVIDGCDLPHQAHGYCDKHRHRKKDPIYRQRTANEVHAIRQLHADGVSNIEFARRIGCSPNTVGRIDNGTTSGTIE